MQKFTLPFFPPKQYNVLQSCQSTAQKQTELSPFFNFPHLLDFLKMVFQNNVVFVMSESRTRTSDWGQLVLLQTVFFG